MPTMGSLVGIIVKHLEVSMDSHVGSSSLLKQVFSNALITTGIIIARIIKRGKIQKSIQDTFCSGSENEGDWEGGGREEGASERASERGRGWMEAGREGGREVRGWGGDV